MGKDELTKAGRWSPPHIHSGISIRKLMLGLGVALSPALGFGLYQYGLSAALLIGVCVLASVLTEFVLDTLVHRKTTKITNFHALVMGLMMAAMLPPGCPLPIAAIGAMVAILLGKAPFGSFGGSFIAPAIVGMMVLFVSWPDAVTQWHFPDESEAYNEKYVAETPIEAVHADPSDEYDYSPLRMFTGQGKVGTIGASSGLALTLGALLLFFLRITRMYATLGYLIGVACAAFVLGRFYPEEPTVWFHLTTGYALFAAMFLVNDIPASPVGEWGMVCSGILAGALTIVLRWAGVGFGAALFAVAFVSLLVPFFDRVAAGPTFHNEVNHEGK